MNPNVSIEKITLINFRNHKNTHISDLKTFIVLTGENGSGKTSVLEAVYILSNGKSFKTAKLSETINFGKNETIVSAVFDDKTTTFYQPRKPQKTLCILQQKMLVF